MYFSDIKGLSLGLGFQMFSNLLVYVMKLNLIQLPDERRESRGVSYHSNSIIVTDPSCLRYLPL